MSDWRDHELERMLSAAFVRDERRDWDAVTQLASPRRRRPPWRVLALASAATLVFGAQALGVTLGVGSLFGANAPTPVKSLFTHAFAGKPIDPSTIRLGAQIRLRDGRLLRLWTGERDGVPGTCLQLQVGASSGLVLACGAIRAGSAGMFLTTAEEPGPAARHASLLIGGIAAKKTRIVRLGFADGTTIVTAAHEGAWAAEIPWAKQRYGHDLTTIEARSLAGTTIGTSHRRPAIRPARPAVALEVVANYDGRLLRVGRGTSGTVCMSFQRSDAIGVDTCARRSAHTGAWIVRVAPPAHAGKLILVGVLPRGATSATVSFVDGHRLVATRTHGTFATELPANHGRPSMLTFRSATGERLSSLDLRGPRLGLYQPGSNGALYTKVTFGRMNISGYVAGPLQWPDGHVTPRTR